jgi:superfamily I DNA/RNA helicase
VARLAIGKSFLTEYGRLDKDVQVAVDAAIARFAKHPHPGIHLEKPQRSWDDRIRTLEVDSHWRGIVLAPETGDTYCLITILPRDKAKAYATSHRFSVNPALGVLEVRDEEAIQQLQPLLREAAEPDSKRLFADVTDDDLARLGVDAQILPMIRLLTSEADLERRQAALPEAQYAALNALACGMTLDEARNEVTRLYFAGVPPERVDPDDLVSAMERSTGQVTFVSGHEELQLILAHPFAAWRMFLHPSQRKIAYRESYSGPAQVTGGPGTGKTVTLLHRAAFLATRAAKRPASEPRAAGQRLRPQPAAGRMLVTTFNGTLADALGAQLDLLIRDDGVRRLIEVLNVDRLAYGIVKAARGAPVIVDERVLRTQWAQAAAAVGLDLTPAFLKNEWEQVILAQGLQTEQAYLTCLRTGRGRPLTKVQRSQVWQAAQRVTAELAAARQSTHLQLANEATHLLRQAGAPRYRHILVDEAQDLHPAQWRLLRAAVAPDPDDLFIVADPHQRIYDNRVSLASMRISVRGRTHRLSLNYRTTQEVLAWAVPLLGTDPVTGLDGAVDSLLGYRSPMHGPHPRLRLAATRTDEFGQLAEQIRAWLAIGIEPQAIGVTARSASLVREAREMLKADGIMTIPLSGRSTAQAVRAGTMHAMKGLEFQAVAVIGVERGLVPEPAAITPESDDPVVYAQDLQRERCVLFVACTRARDHLYVSGTGQMSEFLPAGGADQPSSGAAPAGVALAGAALAGPGGPSGTAPASPRQVSLRELLWLREDTWRPRLRSVSLVAEADLSPGRTRQVAAVLGRLYANLRDPRAEGDSLLSRWPTCLVAAMAGVAAIDYPDGSYWSALWEATGCQGTPEDQGIWGRAFSAAIGRLGMAMFPGLPSRSAEPILMHAGIPAYCLGDYFRLLLARRRLDQGTDAESVLAWATAPGHEERLSSLDEPAQRFLRNGGDYALDLVDRTLDLLDRLTEPDPDFGPVALPGYMIDAARDQLAAGHLDLSGTGRHPADGHRPRTAARQAYPQLALDPYGQGVHVLLPAVSEMPAGVTRWRITADGDPHSVHTRAMWVGAAGTAPQTTCPLDKPARTVFVSLASREDLAAELRLIDPADPVLFFSEDGRRLAGAVSLPRSQVWVIHPADRELEFTGHPGQIVEPTLAVGWEGWRRRLVSLENVQAVRVQGGRPHPVEVRARPRLLLGDPLPGVATSSGSLVYPAPPRLHLPQTLGTSIRWYTEVRRVGADAPLADHVAGPAGEIDIWEGVPRPVLGAFEVTVRGSLGRGLRRTVFVAEGLSIAYHPEIRPLAGVGLAMGKARLTASIGATALPATLRFGPGERAHVVEYRSDAESESLVITPPHAAVLCPGAGVTTWTTSPVHLVAEDFAKAGRLLIRVPGLSRPGPGADGGDPDRLELTVLVRGRPVQAIEASGRQSPGLAGFELARAAGTIAAHGHAELAVGMDGVLMPVGYVRPRRLVPGVELLASGAELSADVAG